MSTETDEIWVSRYVQQRLRAEVDGVRFKSVSDVVREGLRALDQRDEAEGRSRGKAFVGPVQEIGGSPPGEEAALHVANQQRRDGHKQRAVVNDWGKTVFLHTGWTAHYDGSEAPEGGHAYLKQAMGVEAENFKPVDGWCYGYAPVSRTSEGRKLDVIPKANRTLRIEKLGASKNDSSAGGVTVVWTARHPFRGPVIVGLYDDATIYRYMPGLSDGVRPFIAKARVENCHLLPERSRTFGILHKEKGFPGMAAAWFPGLYAEGPAREMMVDVARYLPKVRGYSSNMEAGIARGWLTDSLP